MKQVGRNVTGFDGELEKASHLIHDGDKKYTTAFDQIFEDTGTKIKKLPFRSPDLNAFAERFVLSIKNECLKQCIFLGEESLRKAIREYMQHYHHERNHQGKNNKILFPYSEKELPKNGKLILNTGKEKIYKLSRLGGLLNYYYKQAA